VTSSLSVYKLLEIPDGQVRSAPLFPSYLCRILETHHLGVFARPVLIVSLNRALPIPLARFTVTKVCSPQNYHLLPNNLLTMAKYANCGFEADIWNLGVTISETQLVPV